MTDRVAVTDMTDLYERVLKCWIKKKQWVFCIIEQKFVNLPKIHRTYLYVQSVSMRTHFY